MAENKEGLELVRLAGRLADDNRKKKRTRRKTPPKERLQRRWCGYGLLVVSACMCIALWVPVSSTAVARPPAADAGGGAEGDRSVNEEKEKKEPQDPIFAAAVGPHGPSALIDLASVTSSTLESFSWRPAVQTTDPARMSDKKERSRRRARDKSDRRQRQWASGQLPGSKVIKGTFHGLFRYEPRPTPAPRWVRYRVERGDTLAQIAGRFKVSRAQIIRWNGLRHGLRHGRTLRIRARRFPAYVSTVRYWAMKGDTWETVAEAFGTTPQALRRRNPDKSERELRRGDRLTVQARSALPRWGQPEPRSAAAQPIRVAVPAGAISRGRPSKGRIVRSRRLPRSDLYTLKYPRWSFASTNTMAQLQRGIASFRRRTGFSGEVLITSVSKRRGGSFQPHRSHQSGRDVDIGFVAFPAFGNGQKARGSMIDWGATWALVRELIATGEVERIYLDYGLQKKLFRVARAMGEPDHDLRRIFQYPKGPRSLRGVIRHEPGHDRHFHVRWRCGPSDTHCRGNLRQD